MAKPKKKPQRIPAHVESLIFGLVAGIELRVKVSEKDGIRQYGFSIDGAPVPMTGGQGKIHAPPGVKKLLEWVMVGNPGGSMKVTVTRDGTTVKERKSTIPPPFGKGYDAFEIEVS